MIRYINYLVLVIVFLGSGCTSKVSTTVKLKGTVVNFKDKTYLEEDNALSKLKKVKHEIVPDSANYFELEMELDEPGYYRLGRNMLYLKPGFDLTIYCDANSDDNGIFIGKGAEYNNYLTDRCYPKSGCYNEGGSNWRYITQPEEFQAFAKNLYEYHKIRLSMLQNVDATFRAIERRRIEFDLLNTYIMASSYGPSRIKMEGGYQAKQEMLESYFSPFIDELLKGIEFTKQDLDLEVAISVLSRLRWLKNDYELPQIAQEYFTAAAIIGKLNSKGATAETLEFKSEKTKEITDPVYLQVIEANFAEYKSLMPGTAVNDFPVEDKEGKLKAISDFKGQVVVLDIWATWCGPCKGESPIFHQIADAYNSEPVTFITLSIDTNKKSWIKYIEEQEYDHQYIVRRSDLEQFKIIGVPRFIIIDAKGKIVDAFAPAPSSGKLEESISQALLNT